MNWKQVKDYPAYEVSDTGLVRSYYRRGPSGGISSVSRLLKPCVDRQGYQFVRLKENRVERNFFVHRLVAMAFVPNDNVKDTVNHINGDKLDNRASNLEWMTFGENYSHFLASKGVFEPGRKIVIEGCGLTVNAVSSALGISKRRIKVVYD